MIKQMLEFDATVDAECRFLEHLHSLRKLKVLQDCSMSLRRYI